MKSREVADKLVILRGRKSQLEVATALGVTVSALKTYERGERIPRDIIKMRISNYYNVPIQDIFFQ